MILEVILLVLQTGGPAQRPPAHDAAATAAFRVALEAQQRGEQEQAEAAYRRAVELDPRYAEALVNLGAIVARAGRYDEAVRYYQRALEIDPRLNAARVNLGLAHYRAGRVSAAVDVFRTAHKADPTLLQVTQLLGLALAEAGNDAEAIPYLEASAQAAPHEPAVLFALGRAYAGRGDSRADGIAKRLAETAGGKGLWHQLRGLVLQQEGRHEQALEAFESAAVENPSLPRLSTNIGFSRLAIGDHSAARRAFEAALTLSEQDAAAHLYLAWLDEEAEQLADAQRHALRAVEIDGRLPGARGIVGRIFLKQGQAAVALDHLRQAAADEPHNSAWHFLLAQAYRRVGRSNDAAREFAEATRLKALEVTGDRTKEQR